MRLVGQGGQGVLELPAAVVEEGAEQVVVGGGGVGGVQGPGGCGVFGGLCLAREAPRGRTPRTACVGRCARVVMA
ncbi:hypothetical protein SSCG_02162 [Streptomyces clavuligerus]|nr:hypothetical protein SSCG_02162 [Streptomyces clavuligerus]